MSDWDKFEEQSSPPKTEDDAPEASSDDTAPLAPTTPAEAKEHVENLIGKLNKLADDLWTVEQQLERLKATRKEVANQLQHMMPVAWKSPVHTGDYLVNIERRYRTLWDQEHLRQVMAETGYSPDKLPPFVNSKMKVDTEVLDRQKPDVRDAFMEAREIKNAGTAVEVTPATSMGSML